MLDFKIPIRSTGEAEREGVIHCDYGNEPMGKALADVEMLLWAISPGETLMLSSEREDSHELVPLWCERAGHRLIKATSTMTCGRIGCILEHLYLIAA
jgi:TusA-related sulfurtransferase